MKPQVKRPLLCHAAVASWRIASFVSMATACLDEVVEQDRHRHLQQHLRATAAAGELTTARMGVCAALFVRLSVLVVLRQTGGRTRGGVRAAAPVSVRPV